MRQTFFLFCLLSFQQLQAYHIIGEISSLTTKKIYLHDSFDNRVLDSAIVEKGKFECRGKVKYPIYVNLVSGQPLVFFFLENSEITITGNTKDSHSFQVNGSKSQQEWEKYTTILAEKRQANRKDKQAIQDDYAIFFQQELLQNSYFSVTTLLLFQYGNPYFSIKQKEEAWELLSKKAKKTKYAQSFHQILQNEKRFIGEAITNEILIDIKGNEISFSSFKGKYVLLDFWASWCKPCRQANVYLSDVYQKYHPKGFEIVAISWDRDSILMQEAIQKDKIDWIVVWQKEAKAAKLAQKYGIPYIPFNFLIDPKGTIIAKNISISDLVKMLEEK